MGQHHTLASAACGDGLFCLVQARDTYVPQLRAQ